LEVEAARLGDLLFVLAGVLRDLVDGEGAVGDVDVLGVDIDEVEEVLVHETVVALELFAGDGVVFVEVKSYHVSEGEIFGLVEADEFGVDADGGGAGGEAEDAGLTKNGFFANEAGDFGGDGDRGLMGFGEDLDGDFFGG
jgi:hypothetical protein